MRELVCLDCEARYPRESLDELAVDGLPRCSCGAIVKPAVVLFEEMLPEAEVERGLSAIAGCDLLIVIGSSMVVYPVAGFPAQRPQGARMAIINNEQTSWGPEADVWLGGDISSQCAALSRGLGFAG